jgi:hypothetical protein
MSTQGSSMELRLPAGLTFDVNRGVKSDSGTTALIPVVSSGNGFAPRRRCRSAVIHVDAESVPAIEVRFVALVSFALTAPY